MHVPPILLVTRPLRQAERFVEECLRQTGPVFRPVISPLIGIEPIDTLPEVAPDEDLIFTSENAVNCAVSLGNLKGRTAYCVGDRTAKAAREAGLSAISAGGAAADLLLLIQSNLEPARYVHLHGEHTRGDIAGNLNRSGVQAREAVLYRQVELTLTPEAIAALHGAAPVIVPLFSPRSAQIFFDQAQGASAQIHVIAISAAVAEQIDAKSGAKFLVSTLPQSDSIIKSLIVLMNDLCPLEE